MIEATPWRQQPIQRQASAGRQRLIIQSRCESLNLIDAVQVGQHDQDQGWATLQGVEELCVGGRALLAESEEFAF